MRNLRLEHIVALSLVELVVPRGQRHVEVFGVLGLRTRHLQAIVLAQQRTVYLGLLESVVRDVVIAIVGLVPRKARLRDFTLFG